MNDEIPTNVTGGELNTLWRVANIHFSKIQTAYNDPIEQIHKVNGSPDDDKYGRCHPWWTTVACELERAMFSTVGSLFTTQLTLNRAIDAYTRVDGNNAKELTKLGEDMQAIIDKEGSKAVDWDLPEGYNGPNYNQPDSWIDEHDE